MAQKDDMKFIQEFQSKCANLGLCAPQVTCRVENKTNISVRKRKEQDTKIRQLMTAHAEDSDPRIVAALSPKGKQTFEESLKQSLLQSLGPTEWVCRVRWEIPCPTMLSVIGRRASKHMISLVEDASVCDGALEKIKNVDPISIGHTRRCYWRLRTRFDPMRQVVSHTFRGETKSHVLEQCIQHLRMSFVQRHVYIWEAVHGSAKVVNHVPTSVDLPSSWNSVKKWVEFHLQVEPILVIQSRCSPGSLDWSPIEFILSSPTQSVLSIGVDCACTWTDREQLDEHDMASLTLEENQEQQGNENQIKQGKENQDNQEKENQEKKGKGNQERQERKNNDKHTWKYVLDTIVFHIRKKKHHLFTGDPLLFEKGGQELCMSLLQSFLPGLDPRGDIRHMLCYVMDVNTFSDPTLVFSWTGRGGIHAIACKTAILARAIHMCHPSF